MYSSSLHGKCKESINELSKLSKIKFGQIFSLADQRAINNTLNNKVWRTFWYSEGRTKTKMYIESVYDNAFILVDTILNNIQMYLLPEQLIKSKQYNDLRDILTGIPGANTGIINLKGGYSDDDDFHKWVDNHIRHSNKKMRNIHLALQKYLIQHGLLDQRVIPQITPTKNILDITDFENMPVSADNDNNQTLNVSMEVAQFIENIGSNIPDTSDESDEKINLDTF